MATAIVGVSELDAFCDRALDWLLDAGVETDHGLGWRGYPSEAELNPILYSGSAGIIVTLLEAHAHYGDERYAEAALRGARELAATLDPEWPCGLYVGLSGIAFALHAVHEAFDDPGCGTAAARALAMVRDRFDGERWSDQFELFGGNAGVALGALAIGELDLAVTAATPYLRTAEPTERGVNWEVRTGYESRFHHISHGTLGIVLALASVGAATGRTDFVQLALAGAADVVSRHITDDDGFLVPHSDPQFRPDAVERFSYGWCHGPAGDAQVFRKLGMVTGDPQWAGLADRCWHTVLGSGLPAQRRAGFWDNVGRCCGTAGVLALGCDRLVEAGDDPGFVDVLVADLVGLAIDDSGGVRWSNIEHRATPSILEPRTGWAMGSSGVIRELLRRARIALGGDPWYAVGWPDHPMVRPVG
ncbi:MAG TPA: lanthionine synthetase LanC family protein [Mycobacteriales bacterium]|nr:lanthionine synthetase LanC family protein [Mycobacteriales bacterium]